MGVSEPPSRPSTTSAEKALRERLVANNYKLRRRANVAERSLNIAERALRKVNGRLIANDVRLLPTLDSIVRTALAELDD
jgi:hypothetical protein